MHEVDIAIVGAGLVGVPLALALDAAGWRVALLEQGKKPLGTMHDAAAANPVRRGVDLDARCSALSAGSVAWLREQGFWDVVSPEATPILSVQVTQAGSFGVTRLDAREEGFDAFGQVLANNAMLRAWQALLDGSTVLQRYGFRAERVAHQARHHERCVVIHADDDAQPDIAARLLVAVDGFSSRIRELAGITARHHDYDQVGVLTNVELAEPHRNVAHERFTAAGPLALLPRDERVANVVHSVATQDAERIMALDDAAYLAALQQHFGYRLGRFRRVGSRLSVPLMRIESMAPQAPRTLFLGNAARLLHPVAGQGYNLALRDVAALVRALGLRQSQSADIGSAEWLGRYVAGRADDRAGTVRLTDLLARGFTGSAAGPKHLRSLGLLGLDLIGPWKRAFVRRTTGVGGRERARR
ncbi:MAG: 2-octaprenyl-6-methoxyphenyl hydroxylase [Gammaproteobacteria bacterium]|nr:MAG: 2-octaprenyl-6-methoxyphenyl hydroxylase [Gammaproteobacteria bacterium]